MSHNTMPSDQLPPSLRDYILSLIKKMGYRKKVREEVKIELTDHFTDAISDCKTDEERDTLAQTLIEQFGDPKILAQLIRRAKKRSRPIWKKTLIRTAQASAALLLFFCLYTWWFVTGKPNIAIDYVAQLNQMVRPEASDDQNAWPHYQKAINLYADPDQTHTEIYLTIRERKGHVSFASLSLPKQKAMLNWLTQNEPAWAEYFTAGKQGHFWYDYKTSNPDRVDQELVSVLMPHLGAMKALNRMGIWKARLLIENGETQEALDQCLAIIRTAKHFQHAPWIIEQLVGLAISRDGHNEILHIIHTANLSPQQLADFQNRLAAVYQNGYPKINFEFERLFHLDVVQWYFTDSGPGGGHPLPNFKIFLDEITSMDSVQTEFSIARFPIAMLHAGRHDTLNAFNTAWDRTERQAHLTPWQRHVSADPTAEDYIKSLPRTRYLLVRKLGPVLGRASERVWRGKTLHEATLTILALHRWKLQKGSFPDSLEELIDPGLLKTLPLDPYRNGPLTYKKQGDDFILYSYAGDFDDDNGIQNLDEPWARKDKSGDRRFWPLETPEPSSTDL